MSDFTYESRDVPGSALQFDIGEFSVGDNGDGAKTAPIRLLARAGQPIEHAFWGKVVHDFEGMSHKNRIPIDYRHDEPIGYVNKFDASSGNLELAGALVPFKESDKATEVIHKQRAGVPYEASIDFRAPVVMEELSAGQFAQVNGSRVDGPATIIRQWTLRGVAVCPYGADPNTSSQLSSAETFSVSVKKSEQVMAEETKVEAVEVAVETPVVESPVEEKPEVPAALSEGRKYLEAFGQQGAVWFIEGKAFDECVPLFAKQRADEVAELRNEITSLNKRLSASSAASGGEKSPVEFAATDEGEKVLQLNGFSAKAGK